MTRASVVVDYIKELEENLQRDLVIVETGTIRNTDEIYKEGDGWSTYYICRYLKESNYNHKFYSIDLDVSISRKFLTEQGLVEYVNLLAEHSVTALSSFRHIDLAYLDSANNAELILMEFKRVENSLSKSGVVIVDDVIMDSELIVKGHKVVPYATEKGFTVEIKNRQAIIR